jgi:hypothetical protein
MQWCGCNDRHVERGQGQRRVDHRLRGAGVPGGDVVSDGQWALINAGSALFWVLAMLFVLYRVHRRFEREHQATMARMRKRRR